MLICQCTRELLTAARTYYVRTDGNDSNSGLDNTAAGAFLTIQKAVDVALNTLDFGGFNVTIQVGDGTYTTGANVVGPQVGRGTLTIQGNASTPGNVVISTTNAHGIALDRGALVSVRDLELRTATSGVALRVSSQAHASVTNVVFGAAATYHMQAFGGQLSLNNYTIAGSAPVHLAVSFGAIAYIENKTVTLTGTPNFSTSFVYAEMCGVFRAQSVTFSGSATGTRYYVLMNAAIQTLGGGANYLPGNQAGQATNGGEYL
jgi:hypothetical protein